MAGANGSAPTGRRVVEFVGPAGCGKSTLLQEIARAHPRVRIDLSLWRQPRTRLARSALALTPLFLGAIREGHPLRPSEFAQMVRSDALLRHVRRVLRTTNEVLVIDEGPLFALAWLTVFHGSLAGRRRSRWRHRSLRAWSDLLGGVVQLDAADSVLASRIRRRKKPHPVKGASDEEIARFSESFRRAFESLLRRLVNRSALPIVQRRTDETSPVVEAARLSHYFAGSASGG